VRANEQEEERIAIVAENEAPSQADTELIKATTELAQSPMRVWFSECFHQVGNGFNDLFLECRRQCRKAAVVLPRGLDLHPALALPDRLARNWVT